MTTKKHTCGALLARINGRTLSAVLGKNNNAKQFERFSKKQWVHICPFCDAATLSAEDIPWPFACYDGVMRTSHDFNTQSRSVESEDLDFCGFRFSQTALDSAIRLARIEFDTTDKVEKSGRVFQLESRSMSWRLVKMCAGGVKDCGFGEI